MKPKAPKAAAKKVVRETIIPTPSYNIPAVLLGKGAGRAGGGAEGRPVAGPHSPVVPPGPPPAAATTLPPLQAQPACPTWLGWRRCRW